MPVRLTPSPAPACRQTFFMDDEVALSCELDGIVTVVDAKHIVQHLHAETAEGEVNESVQQVSAPHAGQGRGSDVPTDRQPSGHDTHARVLKR